MLKNNEIPEQRQRENIENAQLSFESAVYLHQINESQPYSTKKARDSMNPIDTDASTIKQSRDIVVGVK